MKELSLYILDIVQNSLAAGATVLTLALREDGDGLFTFQVEDNGRGMSPDLLARVQDPFTTTRKTRAVGLGIPLLRQAAEQAGGALTLESTENVGTTLQATFDTKNIDCPPMGDLAGTVALLIQGAPDVALTFTHATEAGRMAFSTGEVKRALGEGISLAEPEVYQWIRSYLEELELNL